jgi:alkanesulfonate monooxygenase SsuD/methylene tetrahydromethanopterin reductase-like flavin-dependent oxidoreductase (luciferase family)
MEIGIGLPATIPGVKGATILEWARRADQGPFSSLGIVDRLVYPNYEPLITLAAAAGATRRIGLITTVLIAPLRTTAVLAKQVASLDALSGGRLTIGLGIGGREDDFVAAQADFHRRGRKVEEQVKTMKSIWAGEPVSPDGKTIGPAVVQVGGPRLLLGGYSPKAIARAGRLADGYIAGGAADPVQAQKTYQVAEQAWKDAGRAGKPHFVAGTYFVVGEDLKERGGEYLRHYYAQLGPGAERMAASIPATTQAILDRARGLADVGVDELILWPTVPELDQVDRLAEVVSKF